MFYQLKVVILINIDMYGGESVKCPSCGQENKDGSKFCKNCGASMGVSPSPAPVSQPKDNKNTLIICATAIICVIIIAGAFVFLNSGANGGNEVNVASPTVDESVNSTTDDVKADDSSKADSSKETTASKNSVDTMSYSEASSYLSGASGTVISNTFDEADKNKDGILTGSEITKFKSLADLTERTADTSNTEHVEAQDYAGTGDGTTKTRYCTTHGRVAVGSDNRCPYCEAEGLDSRTVKGSTEYI